MPQSAVQRVCIGGALARLALATVARASRELRDEGSFAWVAGPAQTGDLDELLRAGAG